VRHPQSSATVTGRRKQKIHRRRIEQAFFSQNLGRRHWFFRRMMAANVSLSYLDLPLLGGLSDAAGRCRLRAPDRAPTRRADSP
jgi:hypothetical protein